jgi:hypothetical protein
VAALLARAGTGLRFNSHLFEDGAIVFRHACKLGAEGVETPRRVLPLRPQQELAQNRCGDVRPRS